MSLSPSGMIDRASAEITRCIMRIKKKKDGSSSNNSNSNSSSNNTNNSGASANNSSSGKAPNSPNLHHHSHHGGSSEKSQQHADSNSVGGTPVKKCYNSQMGLGNIIMMGTPTRKLNHCVPGSGSGGSSSYAGHHHHHLHHHSHPHHTSPKSRINFGSDLMMDSIFLGYLFKKYFYGLDKLVLPQVCKYWRDTTYALGKDYWDKELLPVLNCKEIRHELLNGAGVRRRFYQALQKRGFTGLKLLCATDEDAEDVMIHFSQGSSLIQTLKLYNSSLTDKGLYSLLDHLSSVEHLELVSCNEITEDGIIKALPINLSSIVILDCIHVADVVFSAVAKLPRLQSFTIQAYHVTDAALSSFNVKVNSNLTCLKLNSCWELTNQALLHIVSSLPHLETLSLSGCSKITDEGVEILAENLTVLKSLDLSWCSRITDSSLECIACDLVSLQQLVLDRCSLITDLGIGYLATMSSLKFLSLRWCSNIRDQAIHHIISIKRLQYLSIAGCTNISPGTLCSLSSLRELKELELTNCGVTPSVIQFLRNTLQHCLVIE